MRGRGLSLLAEVQAEKTGACPAATLSELQKEHVSPRSRARMHKDNHHFETPYYVSEEQRIARLHQHGSFSDSTEVLEQRRKFQERRVHMRPARPFKSFARVPARA